MSQTLLFRPIGQTYAVNCPTSLRGPVQVTEQASCAAFVNLSVTGAMVVITQSTQTGTPPNIAVAKDGTPSGTSPGVSAFILPGNMNYPVTVNVPAGGFNFYGIGVTSGSPTIFCTPCEIIS